MTRERPVRICEGGEVRLLSATRPFTAADIQMSYPIEAAAARAGLNRSRPKLMAFLDRIRYRPAYQRALKRGGGHELLR